MNVNEYYVGDWYPFGENTGYVKNAKTLVAVGGVIALLHDVLVIFAMFAFIRLEVSSMFIAAVLAIIGYSINDTIVIFDRIREKLNKYDKKMDRDTLEMLVNKGIQSTFLRSVYTTLTILIPVIILLLLGTNDILTFNVAMLIGLISGTYSSIYIATTIFLWLEKKSLGKPKKKAKVYKDDIEEKKIKGINC